MKSILLKKQLVFFLIFCCGFAFSQTKIQVPASAVFYMEVNGKQLNAKTNWEKLNPILQSLNKNNLDKPTWKDFSDTGIQKDAKQYHYVSFNDSIKSYTAHLILEDSTKFLEFIKVSAKKELEITKKDKYSFTNLNDDTFVAWDGKRAVITGISYTKKFPKFDYDYAADSTVVVGVEEPPMIDSAYAETDSTYYEPEKPFNYKDEIKYLKDEIKYTKEDIKSHQDEIARMQKDIKYLEKHHKYPEEKKSDTTSEMDEVASAKPTEEYDEEAEDLAYQKEMDSIKLVDFKMVKAFAEKDFDSYFSSNMEVEVPKEMVKFQDPNSDVFVYSNYGEIFKNGVYKDLMKLYSFGDVLDNLYNSNSSYNLYFDKDKVRLVNNYQHRNKETQKHFAAVYQGKKNKKLMSLISDKSIGYYAVNLDGYKYFDLMYNLFENNNGNGKYQKELALMMETVKIVLDEEAISKIAPGNGIFVLNALNTKKVDYTDYEYDENYNSKELRKTKDVVVPDFTFAFATQNDNYWKRVFDVLATNKELSEQFGKNGDIYYLKKDPKNSNYIDQIFFTVKDGVVYLSSSLDNLMVKKQSATSEKWAKDAAKHPASGSINMQRLMLGLEKEFKTISEKKALNLFKKNVGDVYFKTDVKGESLETEFNYTTPNSSENSLMYFFDFCNDLIKISEKETSTAL
ncbi:hypothetical protein NG800_004205 [Epilithonimonas ginsengisoli]|uniref:DUF4836 family protein n=1 Tax=Epilithonimonas ginsengisoli TaxID=1245592 RepID=A0ABU4JEJ8_9FLAO|nr:MULTISPECIES: hypothetical protein [Chryseobacterium group]MBV6879463.1 hypothetical protein [Epilithonimonas sp. FP105]MDW8548099.1 hypothetical protein [Epilithonimonas ginsengisoli]OAH64461.1 hypothetical protein AXA65_19070 [Chryseobacterium sp. FP211-J200]